MTYPTAEQIFDKPWPPPTVQLPSAWQDESIAVELANEECARLLVNHCIYDPPIVDGEIRAYAREFGLSPRQAELELRRARDVE